MLLVADGEQLAPLRAALPTAGLGTIDFDGEWWDLTPGGALASFVTPKTLSGSAKRCE